MIKPTSSKMDEVVIATRRAREARDQGYRELALKLYPHVCGRCSREFDRKNLHELTVHHRDHNHDNNPTDGSNWELLCVYCHDNEHQRHGMAQYNTGASGAARPKSSTFNPFADLKDMLNDAKE